MQKKQKGEKTDIQKNKISGIVLTLLFIITMILIVVILCTSFFGLNISTTNRNITKLENDWKISEGVSSRRANLPSNISLSRSSQLSLSRNLPYDIVTGDVLLLLAEHQNIDVLVDDYLVYTFESTGALNDFCGKQYCFVPLNTEMAGKKLTIIYYVAGNVASTYVTAPVIGSSEAVSSYLFGNSFLVLLFGGFFAIAGIALLAIGAFKSKRTMLAGLFLITLSVRQLVDTGMPQLIIEKESFLYLLNYCCRMMMPVPILWYFAEKLEYKYKLLEYICQIALLNIVVSLVIFMTGAADIYAFSITSQAVLIFAGAILLYVLMVERLKLGKFKLTLPIIAAFMLTVFGMLDIILRVAPSGNMIKSVTDIVLMMAAALMLVISTRDELLAR